MNLRNRGRGCTSQNVPHIYSAGKYPDFAICVRTQIDFCRKGGITTHSDNKTRLNRFIYIYNGRYAHKQDGTRLKMNIYATFNYKLAYLCTKMR